MKQYNYDKKYCEETLSTHFTAHFKNSKWLK